MSGAETREEVLAVSARLFAARGIPGTTMRAIAAECEIKAASLYNHFVSKDEIVAEVMARSSALADGLFRQVGDADLATAERIEALMRATLQSFRAHPEASRMFFENPGYVASAPLLRSARASAKSIDGLWERAIGEAADADLLRPAIEPASLWPLLRSLLLAACHVPGRTQPAGDDVVTILLAGVLRAPPWPHGEP